MKKNLLFVIPSLAAGGGERSLVNLLTQIDYDRFNVDLFLLHPEGMFMELVPKQVRILPLPTNYQSFVLPLGTSIKQFLAKGNVRLAYIRLLYALFNRTSHSIGKREQDTWKYLSASINEVGKTYDTAIGFLEKTSIYFCVDQVQAGSKIGWVHNDYFKLEIDPNFDQPYFHKLDHIVTVSDECAVSLKEAFQEQENKVSVIQNIVSPTVIAKLANQTSSDVFSRLNDELVILTIGRLHPQKGFELAIEACRLLVDKGCKVQWNVIGEGEERKRLTKLIEDYELGSHFRLLGLQTNPYPFIKQTDIYVQTSRYEGKSIAIDEAKILNKPIIVTNFSTAKDQICHGVDGLIVDMTAEAVAEQIMELAYDRELRNTLQQNLSLLQLGTEGEIEKLYKLLG
ncbi:glycosyltransferase [Paenibacillus sp. GSMTC-2017]|uniref:glycosyltransferase n=1 Tax=Paenibacillus sp. GSMTC-2017 TaxID=2794350 RepID=UPI0018D72A35|nr:glycosyltransferase [Paenibacillus sp. GSMTC-2017]MBH5317296.1 glycosyltransferase [Paenibacillus sp. GSMTC-2017]